MAFLDSFKRRRETNVAEVGNANTSTTNQIPKSVHLNQVPFHSAADWLGSTAQGVKPFKIITNPVSVGQSIKVPNYNPKTGKKVITKYNGRALWLPFHRK